MKKQEIEQFIRKYVRDNYMEHPTVFPESIVEIAELAKELAQSYWEFNTRVEIKRDKEAGVTIQDYEAWVMGEIMQLKKAELYN